MYVISKAIGYLSKLLNNFFFFANISTNDRTAWKCWLPCWILIGWKASRQDVRRCVKSRKKWMVSALDSFNPQEYFTNIIYQALAAILSRILLKLSKNSLFICFFRLFWTIHNLTCFFPHFQGSQNERRPGKSYTRSYDGAGPNDRWLICWFPSPLRQKCDKNVTKKWRQEKKKPEPRLALKPSSHLKTKKPILILLVICEKKRPLLFEQQVMIVYSVFFNFSQHLR